MSLDLPIDPIDLAGLLCARLCHDLISPVGAVGNGVGVLRSPTESDMHDDALDLIETGAQQAWARLEFARLAFGAAGSAPGRIDTGELQRVTEKMFSESRSEIDWKVEAEDLEKNAARILLNLCILGVEALPRGGAVTVEADDAGHLTVTAAGPRVRLRETAAAALQGETPEEGFDARSIQPFYVGVLARRAGGKVSLEVTEERVEIVADLRTRAALRASSA